MSVIQLKLHFYAYEKCTYYSNASFGSCVGYFSLTDVSIPGKRGNLEVSDFQFAFCEIFFTGKFFPKSKYSLHILLTFWTVSKNCSVVVETF